jgi:hypothetical protein
MSKPVSLTVHRNTRAKRAERARVADLMERARAAAKLEGGLGGFALVAWNDKGEPTAWWDCGQLPAWSLPDFARRVLENSQDRESEQAADG